MKGNRKSEIDYNVTSGSDPRRARNADSDGRPIMELD